MLLPCEGGVMIDYFSFTKAFVCFRMGLAQIFLFRKHFDWWMAQVIFG
jgi:hypothetical protein